MTTVLTMPEVAESIVEGTIARWLKREGDRVEEYEPLVEVVTDKVNVELPSPATGVLAEILAAVDTTVPVGAELARIEEDISPGAPAVLAAPAGPAPIRETPGDEGGAAAGPRLSPLVRRLAKERGVDMAAIRGTGAGGRVRKQDVLDYAASKRPERQPAAARTASPASDAGVPTPLTSVRATIARRMTQSAREVPHAWTTMQADVSGLVALRESTKDGFAETEGVPLTYLPFFINAAVAGLRAYPAINAIWTTEGIVGKREINVGIAVDRDEGLIVPVLRDADVKSIAELAKELDSLIRRARDGKLALEEVQGGTFTVNNTGSFGSIMSMPIVNQPQVAILATEAIVKRPVVVGDAIAIRSVMHLSISFDHRVLDGGQVGRFLQTVKRALEAYGLATPMY